MKRRDFLGAAAAGLGAAAMGPVRAGAQAVEQPTVHGSKRAPMVLGTQERPPEGNYQHFTRFGVNHICGYPKSNTREALQQLKEECGAAGIKLEMIPAVGRRSIGLVGDQAERDRTIDALIEQIRLAAEVGIPCIKYNITVLNILRTGSTPGRGGSRYSTWRWADARDKDKLTDIGEFPDELAWERTAHVIERIIPVATECKVRMACHPHDPGVPPEGFRGVTRILGTVEGYKKFAALSDSQYHGLNFCVGTVGEMLQDPNAEICDVIRYFGERGKLFNIHFRNIKGKRDDFFETYPDNGSMNMVEVMRTLREINYQYMVMPDHVPGHTTIDGDTDAFAFAYGYIRALLQAINDEPNGPA